MTTTLPAGAGAQGAAATPDGPSDGQPTIVLVHGAWADGSGWQGVYSLLRRDGYTVRVVQNPTISLADDAALTRRVLDEVQGSAVLVGHSYGGAVISEAGTHARVAGLVYVAGWVPDQGESVGSLNQNPEPGAPTPPIVPPRDGFLLLDRASFPKAFAADVPREVAEFMADAQVPWGLGAAEGTITTPAWRSRPSWYLVAKDDRMIAPPLQRRMAARARAQVVEAPGSHAVFVSNPAVVARLITTAVAELRQASVGRG